MIKGEYKKSKSDILFDFLHRISANEKGWIRMTFPDEVENKLILLWSRGIVSCHPQDSHHYHKMKHLFRINSRSILD